MIQVYGIKNCDSVKKAIKYFNENNIEYNFHDFKQNAPSEDTIKSWLSHIDVKKLFNSRSRTYKELGLNQKEMSDEEKVHAMASHPLLIKRPVVELDDTTLCGFDTTLYEEHLS